MREIRYKKTLLEKMRTVYWEMYYNCRAEALRIQHPASRKRICIFKNKYVGKRCFVIGNGPSLTVNDLDILASFGEVTFASNQIYKMFDKTKWRPTFYACSDEKLYKENCEVIDNIEGCDKFLPLDLINAKNTERGFYYFTRIPSPRNRKEPKFTCNLSKRFGEGNTITYHMMQLAAGMGFTEIYLVGVDFSYAISIGIDGKIVEDKNVKNYAWDSGQQPPNMPNIQWNYYAYQSALKESTKHGIKIYNATRGGKLEVFERVDLDSLFKEDMY